jgi:hypothetical protein
MEKKKRESRGACHSTGGSFKSGVKFQREREQEETFLYSLYQPYMHHVNKGTHLYSLVIGQGIMCREEAIGRHTT